MIRVALWAIAAFSVFAAWYALWGRMWLKSKPGMQWLYRSRVGEWTEINLFGKSESVLWGRTLQVVGYVLTAITTFGDVDLTPLAAVLPEKLQWLPPVAPLIISAAGHIQVKLRAGTETSVDIVALSEADRAKPIMAAAIENLDRAKVEAAVAVAVVKEAAADIKGP